MEPAPEMPEVMQELASRWKWVVAAGVLALVLGAIAIIVPAVASVAVATLVGWLLIVGPVFVVADAFRERRFWPIVGRLVLAALWFLAGVWLLVAPLTGTITLTFVLIAWLWADGAFRIVGALVDRQLPHRWLAGLGGVLSLLLGLLIWLDFPSSAAWAIGLLVGINLLFWGTYLLLLGSAGRRLARGDRLRFAPWPA